MYGVIKAIAVAASEQHPYPWNTLPLDAFCYGRGGAYLWGTLCGVLNGGLFVLTLPLGDCQEAADDLVHEDAAPFDAEGLILPVPQSFTGTLPFHPRFVSGDEKAGSKIIHQ